MTYTPFQYYTTVILFCTCYALLCFWAIPSRFDMASRPFLVSCAGVTYSICLSAASALFVTSYLQSMEQKLANAERAK